MFILSLLVDWIKFLFVFPIGVLLGFILYIISYKVTIADLLLMEQLPEVLYMLVMIIFIAYVFVKKQQKTYIQKLANFSPAYPASTRIFSQVLTKVIKNLLYLLKTKFKFEITNG